MEEKTPFLGIESQIQIRLMNDADYENMSVFSCGVKALDDFFHFEVKDCVLRRYLSAYVAFLESGEIVAAFTLMNDALMIGSKNEKEDFIDDLKLETDDEVACFLNRQSSYPAINIGHLGTLKKYQGMGIGSIILDLVASTYANYPNSGCQFITVDALNNPRTTKFYCDNSFGFQTNRDSTSSTRRMYRILL